VVSFNTRTGTVVLSAGDVSGVGGALLASPAFTGTPTAPTATAGTNNTQIASTAFVTAAVAAGAASGVGSWNTRTGAVTMTAADVSAVGGALLASPAFTGTPTAPTQAPGDSTTNLATTAFVHAAVTAIGGVTTFNTRAGAVTLNSTDITGAGGALLASPAFSGTPTAPTPPAADNSTRLATTAFVPIASTTTPLMDGTAAAGSAAAWSRGDHVHPVDTSRYAASNPSGFQTAAQVTASLGSYLPLAGGTMSGSITMPSTATVAVGNINLNSGSLAQLSILNGATLMGQLYIFPTDNNLILANNIAGGSVKINLNVQANPTAGANFLVTPGMGYQAGGGSWGALSDSRIKTVKRKFARGLEAVLKLDPVVYVYKGNDRLINEGVSMHEDVAKRKREFVGLVADDARHAFPELVTEHEGFIDGTKVKDFKHLDTSPLIYALINAIKELTARVRQLEQPA
jgi:hypothetical protein